MSAELTHTEIETELKRLLSLIDDYLQARVWLTLVFAVVENVQKRD